MTDTTTRPHGCFNHAPYVDTVTVPDGWAEKREIVGLRPILTRLPRLKTIPNPMTKPCQYTLHQDNHADPRCAGCSWQAQPQLEGVA